MCACTDLLVNLPWIQKWWCQPSRHSHSAGRIISEQCTHRLGARHLTDGRWISLHKVHGIFHRQFRIGFKDLRLSRLFNATEFEKRRENKKKFEIFIIFVSPLVVAHLNVLQYKWTNEFIIESFEFVAHIVVSSFANDILHASHQMID